MKKVESQLEDVNLALELIKQYGFNPKEYNEMIKILKDNKSSQNKLLYENFYMNRLKTKMR